MPYHYEATSDFEISIKEVETLIDLARSDEDNRNLFLKLAAVSSVTKFQVYIERVLASFRKELNGIKSKNLSTYMKMNSLRISIESDNPLTGLTKHRNFTDEKKDKIINYLNSISYLTNGENLINDKFNFNTKFPLGKTGQQELIDLFKQIDGNDKPFTKFDDTHNSFSFDTLNSVLNLRHGIIHQDRFQGTDMTIQNNLSFIKELVKYIDEYLSTKISEMTN